MLIDCMSLYHEAQRTGRDFPDREGKVDYTKMVSLILGDRFMAAGFAYTVSPDRGDNTRFKDILRDSGLVVGEKPLTKGADGKPDVHWEVAIACEAMRWAAKVDVIILVSGSSAYVDLLRALKGCPVRVEVASFEKNASLALKRQADRFIALGEEVLIEKRRKSAS